MKKMIKIGLTASLFGALLGIAVQGTAATVQNCAAILVRATDDQVCSRRNIVFASSAVPNRKVSTNLVRIDAAVGRGIIIDGHDRSRQPIGSCTADVTGGGSDSDSDGCEAMVFYRTHIFR